MPSEPHGSISVPGTTNAFNTSENATGETPLTKLTGYHYPSQSRMAADFLKRRWNAMTEPGGSNSMEQIAAARRIFDANGAQCAQLCVANALDVINAQQKHSQGVNVSNFHLHAFRKLLHDHETSLHPQNVMETFAAASDGQPMVDCEMHVIKLFSCASNGDVDLFWAYGRRIPELEDVVVPDPWLQQPILPCAFIV